MVAVAEPLMVAADDSQVENATRNSEVAQASARIVLENAGFNSGIPSEGGRDGFKAAGEGVSNEWQRNLPQCRISPAY